MWIKGRKTLRMVKYRSWPMLQVIWLYSRCKFGFQNEKMQTRHSNKIVSLRCWYGLVGSSIWKIEWRYELIIKKKTKIKIISHCLLIALIFIVYLFSSKTNDISKKIVTQKIFNRSRIKYVYIFKFYWIYFYIN